MSTPRAEFVTPKGTTLPLTNLKGKEYLMVNWRVVWFREDHPKWGIETEFVSITDKSACAKATIRDESGRIVSTSHKFEDQKGFPDFLEKAETGSIGRALALIGYGTQFCADELDEGKRIVDGPVNQPGQSNDKVAQLAQAVRPPAPAPAPQKIEEDSEYLRQIDQQAEANGLRNNEDFF